VKAEGRIRNKKFPEQITAELLKWTTQIMQIETNKGAYSNAE